MKYYISFLVLFLAVVNVNGYELGSGSGSSYPVTLDTDYEVETATNYARESVPNDTNAAVIKIETELGTNPSGTYSTVAERLTNELGLTISHNTSIDGILEVLNTTVLESSMTILYSPCKLYFEDTGESGYKVQHLQFNYELDRLYFSTSVYNQDGLFVTSATARQYCLGTNGGTLTGDLNIKNGNITIGEYTGNNWQFPYLEFRDSHTIESGYGYSRLYLDGTDGNIYFHGSGNLNKIYSDDGICLSTNTIDDYKLNISSMILTGNTTIYNSLDIIEQGGTSLLRINQNGNVGIGTSNPTSKFCITGDNAILNRTGSNFGLFWYKDLAAEGSIYGSNTGGLSFRNSSLVEIINFNSSGQVTLSSSLKTGGNVQIVGNIDQSTGTYTTNLSTTIINGNLTTAGNITVSGLFRGLNLNYTTVTDTYTIVVTDVLIITSNAVNPYFQITLPAVASYPGRILIFTYDPDTAGSVVLIPTGENWINGQTSLTLTGAWRGRILVNDANAQWITVGTE